MTHFKTKLYWFIENSLKLCIVLIRVLIHCLIHPKKLFKLLFSFVASINEFYQVSHGKLKNFKDTDTFKQLQEDKIFAKCNYFNLDLEVSRPIENQVIASLVSYLNPKTIFEIGTYSGYTTLHFAQNSSKETKIYTLDLPPEYNPQEQLTKNKSQFSHDDLLVINLSKKYVKEKIYDDSPHKIKIQELLGDSKTFDYSPYYGKMDLIYIDGSHSYHYVQSDTENAFKMLAQNGVIIWHDYDYIVHRDVFKYLNALSEQHTLYSIPYTRFAIYGKTV